MKTNIFIDFDNTIVNSTKAFIDVYKYRFPFININYMDIENYDFKPHLNISKEEICSIFSSDDFYDKLELYQGVEEILKLIKDSELFNVILITNCSPESIPQKIKFLKQRELDKYFDFKIYLDSGKPYDKSIVNMSKGILIDDHRENHLFSNATYKLCYKHNPKQTWCPDDAITFSKWDKKLFYYLEYIAEHNHTKAII